jgi:uncharacterized protein YjbJ (UPF0337 family)
MGDQGDQGMADKAKGLAKEAMGKLTGDEDTEREGEHQQAKGQKQDEAARAEEEAARRRQEAAGHASQEKRHQD